MLAFRLAAPVMLTAVLCAGCAYTKVLPVDPHDRMTEGLRVYDTKPILVVGSSIDIKFIPNYSRSYVVQFGAFLSKNDVTVQVENGVIKQLDSKLDTTAIVDLLKAIAEKAIPLAGGTANGLSTNASGGLVRIYDFEFDDYGNLIAFRPIPFLGGQPNTHRIAVSPLIGSPSAGATVPNASPSKENSPTTPGQPNTPRNG